MRYLLFFLVVLWFPFCSHAKGVEANTLSKQEVKDGWILLFDGQTTFGWHSPTETRWKVSGGALTPEPGKPGLLVSTTALGDYELSLEYQVKRPTGAELLLRCDNKGKPVAQEDRLALKPNGGKGWLRCVVRVIASGEQEKITRRVTQWHGRSSVTRIIGSSATGKSLQQPHHIGLAGKGLMVRNIKLRPVDMKSIFNGKDLTGWKVHPGLKSRYTVTREGWLNVKNGRGDIQTTGQWADFILQLECISHGKHLNSGVFFRCLPGQYQQGYEAQIHNHFTEKPSKTYTLPVYDPKTHKKIGTREVLSTARDFGTGGLYRRQPARMGVSKDNEWFTMTVVAHGRHLATWVNGIQVTDWVDNRPANDNPRRGYRAEKGAISLQGHDPTTHLSFRNFRIQNLRRE